MNEGALRVGFIGLGQMGAGIARNIQSTGFPLTVYNRTAAKTRPFVDAGAEAADSPQAAVAGADVVVTSLMDDASVLETVTSERGILAGLRPGGIHVGTTTISPACARQLAELHSEHGSAYIGAPVVGRPNVAEAGELRTFAAGAPDAVARCTPVLESYSQMVLTIGEEPHLAHSLKLCVNYAMMSVVDLMGQVYVFGEKSGVPASYLSIVMAAMFPQPELQEYARRTLAREFDSVGFTLRGGLKDVELFLKAGEDVHTPLPYAVPVRDKLQEAVAQGMGELDWSAVYEITRQRASLD